MLSTILSLFPGLDNSRAATRDQLATARALIVKASHAVAETTLSEAWFSRERRQDFQPASFRPECSDGRLRCIRAKVDPPRARPGPARFALEHGPHSAPRAPSSLRYRTPRPSTSAIALRLSALRSGGRPASRCENGHKPAGTLGSASCGCGVAAQKRDMAILATPWLVWV